MKKTYIAVLVGLVLASAVVYYQGASFVVGNPSQVQGPVICSSQGESATALATTSVTYMTAGTATTTVTCNMSRAGNGTESFDEAVLAVQFTGSSTASIINVGIEYSNDGIDWYSNGLMRNATTTQSVNVNVPTSYNWGFASTTVGGLAGNTTRDTNVVEIPTPLKYVRAVITMPAGSLNGAVWAQIIGKNERGY